MIVCHPLKLIFIKTKKVGGTSFEIALSRYCSSDCIITEIQPEDEAIRQQLGFRGAQNARWWNRRGLLRPDAPNFGVTGNFRNHDTAAHVRRHLGQARFGAYFKLSIQRDPLDFLVSQYFYRFRQTAPDARPRFSVWCQANQGNVLENHRIAPAKGPYACDLMLRYEHLEEDLALVPGLPSEFRTLFSSLGAKGGIRPQHTRDARAFSEAEGMDPDAPSQWVQDFQAKDPF